MPTRAIVIVPRFAELARIETFRQQFDPLAASIPAHLTLVFPFDSDLTTAQLQAHVQTIAATVAPFPIELQGITGQENEYLLLNVKRGNDELIALHDQLYSGVLEFALSRAHTFIPHLTVGRCPDRAQFQAALATACELDTPFTTTVDILTTFQITPPKHLLEFTTPLLLQPM